MEFLHGVLVGGFNPLWKILPPLTPFYPLHLSQPSGTGTCDVQRRPKAVGTTGGTTAADLVLSGIPFWHSIWHIFWHSIWHIFWHFFWHSIWRRPRPPRGPASRQWYLKPMEFLHGVLVGGFNPLWKILVSWDDSSQYISSGILSGHISCHFIRHTFWKNKKCSKPPKRLLSSWTSCSWDVCRGN